MTSHWDKYNEGKHDFATPKLTEKEEAIKLANKILDSFICDPDSDLSMLSRQLLRALEQLKAQEKPVEMTVNEFNDLIDPQMPSFNNIGNLLLNRFPNGIKIIDGADHGP